MKPLLLLVAVLAVACSTHAPTTPTDPSGDIAHTVPPAAYVRIVKPTITVEAATPAGFPVSGQVVNWGHACARHVSGTVDLLPDGAPAIRLTWSLPDVIPPGGTATFRTCCGPLSIAGQTGSIDTHVQSESGC